MPVGCAITCMKSRSGGNVDGCTHMQRKFDGGKVSSRLGYRKRRQNLGIPIRPRDEATVGGVAFPDENPNRNASKQMIACFCAKFGHVATIPLEDRKTVTADWHANHCLSTVFQAWCKRRPRTGVRNLLLHHDNASAHTAAVTGLSSRQ